MHLRNCYSAHKTSALRLFLFGGLATLKNLETSAELVDFRVGLSKANEVTRRARLFTLIGCYKVCSDDLLLNSGEHGFVVILPSSSAQLSLQKAGFCAFLLGVSTGPFPIVLWGRRVLSVLRRAATK